MAATLTTMDNLSKIVYLDGLPDYVNSLNPLFDRLKKRDQKQFKGRNFTFAAKTSNSNGSGAIGEDEELPDGGNVGVINFTAQLKYHYAVARMTAQTMELIATDRGAFRDAVKEELDSVKEQLAEDLAVNATYGTGYGDLGRASTYSTPTLTMQDQPTVGAIGTRLLREGMLLYSYSALTGGVAGATGAAKYILTVDSETVATTTASAGINASDYIFRGVQSGVDPRDKAIMGLRGLVDDGTFRTSIQGITRSAQPTTKANVLPNSGSLRGWSEDLWTQACTKSQLAAGSGGAKPTAIYSTLEIMMRAASQLKSDRTFDMQRKTYEGGYQSIAWTFPGGTADWFWDRYVYPNTAYFVHEPDLFWAIGKDIEPVNTDGGIWRYTDRNDTVEAWFRTWRNLCARRFRSHTVVKDISHTA